MENRNNNSSNIVNQNHPTPKPHNHPVNQMEYIQDTATMVSAFASVHNISELIASNILILSELRCMHWHIDEWHPVVIEQGVRMGVLTIKNNNDGANDSNPPIQSKMNI